jgi:uncharacterized protein (TIGR02678 family)
VSDTRLAEHLATERSLAVRTLLRTPLLDSAAEPEGFRAVVRHADWLTEYFEQSCGWALTIDASSGFARLAKRRAAPDLTRPLRRTRGDGAPFDRRRYQILCLVCAELVRHPTTTVGLLARAVTADATLDTSKYGERGAFVDALRALISWGVVRVSAGEVDAFLDNERANAILIADTAQLHRLLSSATAPSALPDGLTTEQATHRLLAEPRYGDAAEAPEELSDEARNRFARHQILRRVLDDPVLHLDDVSPVERDYLASLSGRRWVRERVAEAGFELEERAEGLLAADPQGVATDRRFPAPLGHAHQLALLLVDQLVGTSAVTGRTLFRLDADQLRRAVQEVLDRFPGWAKAQRTGDGVERLARDATAILVGFGLAESAPDGTLTARPALARYRVGQPVFHTAGTLFEEAGS